MGQLGWFRLSDMPLYVSRIRFGCRYLKSIDRIQEYTTSCFALPGSKCIPLLSLSRRILFESMPTNL